MKWNFLKRENNKVGRVFVISAVISIILVKADYLVQNFSFPFMDDSILMAHVDVLMEKQMEKKKTNCFFDEKDVTYVNFGKDKSLVPVLDEFNDTIGNDVITDRKTLLEFLELAKKSDYKFLFLDVRFEKGYETPYDSALFSLIKEMPRLVIATHRGNGGYEIIDSSLLDKSAYADYRGSIFSGFTRYEFLQDGGRSVALQMYYDIDEMDITKRCCSYRTTGCIPCYNLKYIPLPHYLFKGKSKNEEDTNYVEEIRYLCAGSMILNRDLLPEEEVIKNLLDKKIVVVGDFDNDLHGTYVGEIPGPVLSLAAYKYLHAGLHKVSCWYALFLFLLYFLIAFFTIISQGHIANFFEGKPVWHFIVSLFSLSFVFLIIKILLYRFFLISMVMFVPTIIFWIITTCAFAQYEKVNRKKEKKVA